MRKIQLIDDDVSIRRSVQALLATVNLPCETYADGPTFFAECDAEACGPILLDVRMPGTSGHQVLQRIMAWEAPPPVLMISGVAEVADAIAAMKAGASDFLEKPLQPARLIDVVQQMVAHQARMRRLAARRAAVKQRLDGLTRRERDILRLIVAGYANKQMALEMGISPRTVECHRNRVMRKMHADSLAELVRMVAACPAVRDPAGTAAACDLDPPFDCDNGDCRVALIS